MSNHREEFHCRQCGIHSRLSGGRRPFVSFSAKPHYAPDLPARLERLVLEATVDPRAKSMEAIVRETFRVIQPGLSSLRLDQAGLEILEVSAGGKPAPFEVEGGRLRVGLPEGVQRAAGDAVELAIRYRKPVIVYSSQNALADGFPAAVERANKIFEVRRFLEKQVP